MGGSSSKLGRTIDPSGAQLSVGEAQRMADAARDQALEAGLKQGRNTVITWIVVVIVGLGLAGGLIYYFISRNHFTTMKEGFNSPPDLAIRRVRINNKDDGALAVTLQNKISNSELHVTLDDSLKLKKGDTISIEYQYTGGKVSVKSTYYGEKVDIVPDGGSSWDFYKWFQYEISGNHLPTAKSAEIASTMNASQAPLSDGSYGYQFWMYIKDWNYKFGEEKNVFFRSDATNSSIMNPNVTLHPTDNTLRVSVSIFPSNANSSKTEPAPAGHSGATDDVFTCDVPNIPLQTWTAVAVTVSSRNLDVYLNGNLVKSCVLSGVPKPSAGDIQLNSNGGFSGWMCSFYHYSKLLLPSDVQSFYNSGVSCSIPGTAPSNYNVTFGLFDTKGKEVSKYVF